MKILVIDSHKGSSNAPSGNLHWKNARKIADALGGDLIWSYPSVNDAVRGGYDAIIFVHASPYAYTDYAWVEASPSAELFYVSNEYNLGEPRTLWMAAKAGRRFSVIANHPAAASKVVRRNVDRWHIVNLNSLCYERRDGVPTGSGIVYYGSFRKGRADYFRKWLRGDITVSTHAKNRAKFTEAGCVPTWADRLDLDRGDLRQWSFSLYLEDVVTHTHYNFLANRFYEALSWGVSPVFDPSCWGTVHQSGYQGALFCDGMGDLPHDFQIPEEWHQRAFGEHCEAIQQIDGIVRGTCETPEDAR